MRCKNDSDDDDDGDGDKNFCFCFCFFLFFFSQFSGLSRVSNFEEYINRALIGLIILMVKIFRRSIM